MTRTAGMHVERVKAATPELVEALQRLVPQLSANSPAPGRADLAALLSSDLNALVVARYPDDHGSIVGAGALGMYRVPTGVRAVIEDVVVDEGSRGLGVGEAVVRTLLQLARDAGARGVSLTSSPRRQEANRLYVRLGFTKRETNSYYYSFS